MEVAPLSYLDDDLVDQLWMRIKREGIDSQREQKIENTVRAGAKFGLGNVLSWIVGDLRGELGAEAVRGRSMTTTYAAPYRLLFLLELLPTLKRVSVQDPEATGSLQVADFVDIHCQTLSLAPLPRLGDYWNAVLTNEIAGGTDGAATAASAATLQVIEKYSTYNRAISFWARLQDMDGDPGAAREARDRSAITRLDDECNETLTEMLSLSDNDLTLGASLWLRETSPNPTLKDWEIKVSNSHRAQRTPGPNDHLPNYTFGFGADYLRQQREEREAEERAIKSEALEFARSHSDTLIVTCFQDSNLKKNVAALSTSGDVRLFGRVLSNKLETRTRVITVQPITLSVAAASQ